MTLEQVRRLKLIVNSEVNGQEIYAAHEGVLYRFHVIDMETENIRKVQTSNDGGNTWSDSAIPTIDKAWKLFGDLEDAQAKV